MIATKVIETCKECPHDKILTEDGDYLGFGIRFCSSAGKIFDPAVYPNIPDWCLQAVK